MIVTCKTTNNILNNLHVCEPFMNLHVCEPTTLEIKTDLQISM